MINKAKIIGYFIGVVIVLLIGTIMFWGLGNLVIYAFGINYNWTILHGLVCQLVFMLMKQIFAKCKS